MNQDLELSERERLILRAVVHTYITTAEPVGSRSVVRRFGLDLSAATVRNVMYDLEEAGFLQQLHTSSGRVPTDRGYRYYVDYLMRAQELTLAERTRIEREFRAKMDDADEVMRQTSHLLALISHQTGIVEAPAEENAMVRRIELVSVSEMRVAVMVVDNYGRVRTMMVPLDVPLEINKLAKLNGFLNEHLEGVPVNQLASSLHETMRTLLDEQRQLAQAAVRVLDLVPHERPGQLFLEGATQLFEQPEFRDVNRAREVFNLLEERKRLAELLRMRMDERGGARSWVVIGSETQADGLEDISVVASPYCVEGRTVGLLGVLGPRRMPYSRLTAVVEYTASMLGRFLTRLAG
ncbi:MAG TPA: heat-inducible transcription repressor HrcA [Candidatus Hydrogenedentes bacterium]|nr:heat-inducible transcription repressor HrcA [Candidatus Hydrogenedentota bacterium]